MKYGLAGKVIRILIIVGCALMVWWYADSRIVNIGSITGTIFFLCIGLVAAFFDEISGVMKRLRRNKKARYITNGIFGVLGALGLYLIVVSCLMTAYSLRPAPEGSTVVVLGCQVNGSNPSMMLNRRIEAAADYLLEHPDSKCIVSGGKGKNENISEAECMYRELVARGVPPERIYKEDASSNTDENIRFSGEIIKREGLPKELAIVTDGFHQFRAAMAAEKYGYICGAVSASTPTFLLANFATREIIAVTAGFFFP